jgi:hypothetical protein
MIQSGDGDWIINSIPAYRQEDLVNDQWLKASWKNHPVQVAQKGPDVRPPKLGYKHAEMLGNMTRFLP